jgi:hypothetical protein
MVSYWIFTDIALDVDTLNNEQKRLLNECAEQYGMKQDDFVRYVVLCVSLRKKCIMFVEKYQRIDFI